ncbi:MAG: glycosyltransferase family 39 protein [Acidimicrobiales bacterium]|nr:glycosyltransferase family 39 protein [Acidimicrobiales bacterium]
MLGRLRNVRVQLALVAASALLVRLWAIGAWSQYQSPEGDEAFYWRQAQYLADGFGFVYRNNFGELVTTAVHPPLYSAYLAFTALFGFSDDSHVPYRVATALLGVATVVVVGLVGRRVAGAGAGVLAAGLAAFYPNLWINDAKLTAESLYALLVALVLFASLRYLDEPSGARAAVLGAVVGLAALTRAEAVMLLVLLVAPLILWRASLGGVRQRTAQLGVAIVAGLAVMAPWVVRNLVVFERPALLSTGGGFVLEISNCDQTYGLAPPRGPDGSPRPDASADTYLGYWARDCDRSDRAVYGNQARPWPAGDETVVEQEKRRIGLDYMRDHWRLVPKVIAARVGRIWDLWRPGQSNDFNLFFERRNVGWVIRDCPTGAGQSCVPYVVYFQAVGMAMYYVMLPLAVAGGVVLWRRAQTVIPFVAVAASATLTAAVSFGITRYRVAADVAIPILAAVAVTAGWRVIRTRRPLADRVAGAVA